MQPCRPAWAVLFCIIGGCGSGAPPAAAPAPGAGVPLLSSLPLPALAADGTDGEDDGVAPDTPAPLALATARAARMVPIALPAGAHPLVCDLVSHRGALYISTAVAPIDVDGARIYRLAGDRASLIFDWDRGGAPHQTHEIGGQGLTRLRVLDDRLWVPDADAPLFGGFGLGDAPFEDYLFVGDATGGFPALAPDLGPPAGTRILPLAFHAFDVIRYRGAVVASGGTVAASDAARTRYPGGLWAGDSEAPVLPRRFTLGEDHPVGVVRATYLHRYRGRLYIGLQNNGRRIRWDLAVLSGDPTSAATPPPVLARVTADGGWLTRRFASGDGWLSWVASGYRGDGRGAAVWGSRDGLRFQRIALPPDAGQPQDLLLLGTTRYLLTDTGLWRAGRDHRFEHLAPAPAGEPFGAFDTFCSAPLTSHAGALYAGATRGATVYRIDASR